MAKFRDIKKRIEDGKSDTIHQHKWPNVKVQSCYIGALKEQKGSVKINKEGMWL